MKKRIPHIARAPKPAEYDCFSFSIGTLEIARRSEAELIIQLPASTGTLQRVVVNGEVFHREGSLRQVVRVAPLKYGDDHFKEVNELQRSRNYSATAALEEVAKKYAFNLDGFKRQYYARGWHAPKKSTG
ncbi:MAG: hypothetical protein NTV54_08580 [Ignavibacteriales bacterium]|nr:hypothetical protein [Ignavibacteriales bacterium]